MRFDEGDLCRKMVKNVEKNVKKLGKMFILNDNDV